MVIAMIALALATVSLAWTLAERLAGSDDDTDKYPVHQ